MGQDSLDKQYIVNNADGWTEFDRGWASCHPTFAWSRPHNDGAQVGLLKLFKP